MIALTAHRTSVERSVDTAVLDVFRSFPSDMRSVLVPAPSPGASRMCEYGGLQAAGQCSLIISSNRGVAQRSAARFTPVPDGDFLNVALINLLHFTGIRVE